MGEALEAATRWWLQRCQAGTVGLSREGGISPRREEGRGAHVANRALPGGAGGRARRDALGGDATAVFSGAALSKPGQD